MSDPTTPDTPDLPATPTSDEATALALLDARGRRAATNLLASVDRLVVGTGESDVAGGVDVAFVGLRPASPRRGLGRGRSWLIAAAVLVVCGLVTAVVLLQRAGDEEGVVSQDGSAYLVPGWMPDGWDLQDARSVRIADVPGALTGTVAVYADPAADDPWVGPKLSVWQTTDDGLGLDANAGVEQIEVGGEPATIEDRDGTIIVRVMAGDEMVMVMADQVDRPLVLAAAEAALAGDVAGARPEGWERLASGPVGAVVATGTYALDGVALVYGGGSSANGQVVVVQQAGDRDDAELVRLATADPGDVEVVEVRDLPAYLVEGALLQWYEPSAHAVVTLTAGDTDRATLLRFAEELRPSRPGEVDDLVKANGSSGPFGRLQPGEVVVAEGELPEGELPEGEFPEGHPWRLVASDDGSGGFGLTFADGAGSSGVGVDRDGGWGTLSAEVADHQMAGDRESIGVYGAVTPEAGEVVIEAPGHESIHLELHTVDIAGWDEKVFAGVVPTDLGPAQAVALAPDGTELARVPVEVAAAGSG